MYSIRIQKSLEVPASGGFISLYYFCVQTNNYFDITYLHARLEPPCKWDKTENEIQDKTIG